MSGFTRFAPYGGAAQQTQPPFAQQTQPPFAQQTQPSNVYGGFPAAQQTQPPFAQQTRPSSGGFSAATLTPGTSTPLGAAANAPVSGTGYDSMRTGGFFSGATPTAAPLSGGFGRGAPVTTTGFPGSSSSSSAAPVSTGVTSTGIPPPPGFQPNADYIVSDDYFDLSPAFFNLPNYEKLKELCIICATYFGKRMTKAEDFRKYVDEVYTSTNNNLFAITLAYLGVMRKDFAQNLPVVAKIDDAVQKIKTVAGEAVAGGGYTAFKGMIESFKLFQARKARGGNASVTPSSPASFMNASAAAQQQQLEQQQREQQQKRALEEEMRRHNEELENRKIREQQQREQQQRALEEEMRRHNEELENRKIREQQQREEAERKELAQRLANEAQREKDLLRQNSATLPPDGKSIPSGTNITPKFSAKPKTGQQSSWGVKAPTSSALSSTTNVTSAAREEKTFPATTLVTNSRIETVPPVVVSGGDYQRHIAELEKKVKDLTSTVNMLMEVLEEHKRESTSRHDALMSYLDTKFRSLASQVDNLASEEEVTSSSSRAQSPSSRAQSPSPRAQSPSPRAQSPSPRTQSPSPRTQSPSSPRTQSPSSPRPQSPSFPFTNELPRDVDALIDATVDDVGAVSTDDLLRQLSETTLA
jgi:hypothetical protein